jgi:hypothetical protein
LHHFLVVVVVVVDNPLSSLSFLMTARHKASRIRLRTCYLVQDSTVNNYDLPVNVGCRSQQQHTAGHLFVLSTTHLRNVALVGYLLSREVALLSVVGALGCHFAGEVSRSD